MKRNWMAMAAAALVIAFLLSGCGEIRQKPAPTETVTQRPAVYIIDGTKILKRSDEGSTPIYDASDYFDKGWNCWLDNLVAEGGTIYFTESGMLGDDEENSEHRIIRLDESGRKIIDEKRVTGYTQLVPYGNRIVFVQDGFDSQDIGWAYKDGSASAYLDFSEYAARYGVEAYYNGATLSLKDGVLYADIAFFVDDDPETEEEIEDHTVSISEDLEITRIE